MALTQHFEKNFVVSKNCTRDLWTQKPAGYNLTEMMTYIRSRVSAVYEQATREIIRAPVAPHAL